MKQRNKENLLSVKKSKLSNNTARNGSSAISDPMEVCYNLRHTKSRIQKEKSTKPAILPIVGKAVGSARSEYFTSVSKSNENKRILKRLHANSVTQENIVSAKKMRSRSKNESISKSGKHETYMPDEGNLAAQNSENTEHFCVSDLKTIHDENRFKRNHPHNVKCDATITTSQNSKYNLRKQSKIVNEKASHAVLTAQLGKENSFPSKTKKKKAAESKGSLNIQKLERDPLKLTIPQQSAQRMVASKHDENINQLTVIDATEEIDSLPSKNLRSNIRKHELYDKVDRPQANMEDKNLNGLRVLDLNTFHHGKKSRKRVQTDNSSTKGKCNLVPNDKNSRYNLRKQISLSEIQNSSSTALNTSAKGSLISTIKQKHLPSTFIHDKEQDFKRPHVTDIAIKSSYNSNKKNVFSDDAICPVARREKTKQSNRLKLKIYDFDDISSESLNPISDLTNFRAKYSEKPKCSIKGRTNRDVKYSINSGDSNTENLRYNFRNTSGLTKSSLHYSKNIVAHTVKTNSLHTKKGQLLTLTPNLNVGKIVQKKPNFNDIKKTTKSSLCKKYINNPKKPFRDQSVHSAGNNNLQLNKQKVSHKNLKIKTNKKNQMTKKPIIAYVKSAALPENQETPNILQKELSTKGKYKTLRTGNILTSVTPFVDNPAESTLRLNCETSTPAPEYNSDIEDFEITITEAVCEKDNQFDITLYDSPDELSPIKKVPDSPCSTTSTTSSFAVRYHDMFSYSDEKTDEYLKTPNIEVKESVLKPKKTYRTPQHSKKCLFKNDVDIPHQQLDVENDVPKKKTKLRGQAALNNWASEMNKHFGEVEMEDLHVE